MKGGGTPRAWNIFTRISRTPMIWKRIWKSDTYTILLYIGDPFQSVLEQIQGIWHDTVSRLVWLKVPRGKTIIKNKKQ